MFSFRHRVPLPHHREQWLGRLWNDYRKIAQLRISLSEFHSHKKEIDSFFQSCPLANEWKINDQPQSNPNNSNITGSSAFLSTNPFLNDLNDVEMKN